jgi:PPOX class probable F420-dependent enzyme
VRHIAEHAKVSFALNTDPDGDEVTVLIGTAVVDGAEPPACEQPACLHKYRKGIAALGKTPEEFARDFSIAIRINPTGLRWW